MVSFWDKGIGLREDYSWHSQLLQDTGCLSAKTSSKDALQRVFNLWQLWWSELLDVARISVPKVSTRTIVQQAIGQSGETVRNPLITGNVLIMMGLGALVVVIDRLLKFSKLSLEILILWMYVCHLIWLQGLPFSIVPVPVPEAKSCRPVQDLLCGTVLYLSMPTSIDVVAIDVKQRQQRKVPSRDTGRVEATDPVVIVRIGSCSRWLVAV